MNKKQQLRKHEIGYICYFVYETTNATELIGTEYVCHLAVAFGAQNRQLQEPFQFEFVW